MFSTSLHLAAHRDALQVAHVLHRDISLFNLLLVLAMQSDLGVDFVDRALQEPECTRIQEKIHKLSRRGLLGDWGYGIPMGDVHHSSGPTPGIRVAGQTKVLGRKDLHDTHSIVIPVADQPLPEDASESVDASPLQRTVCILWHTRTSFS